MSTAPTDALALLREIYAELEQGAIPNNDDPWWQRAAACIAKWGQPAQAAEPTAYLTRNAEGDPAMLFFDKDEASTYCEDGVDPEPLVPPHQPVAQEPLSYEQIQDLLLCGNPTDEEMRLIRIGWDAARGIKGENHDR